MIVLLDAQILAAEAGLLLLALRVLPSLTRFEPVGLLADVWLPLSVALPLILLARHAGPAVDGAGWVPVGAPAGIATMASGLLLFFGRPYEVGRGALFWLAATGVLLLLLGAAFDLTIWVGQCIFALAAVLLWINTPHPPARPAARTRDSGGAGMVLVLLLAAGQGAAGCVAHGGWAVAAMATSTAYAATATVLVALRAPAGVAGRIIVWTATLGTLLGLGTLSLVHMLPQTAAVLDGARPAANELVAHGFGAFAVESILLLAIPAALVGGIPAGRSWRRTLGAVLAVAGAGLLVWRLAGLVRGEVISLVFPVMLDGRP